MIADGDIVNIDITAYIDGVHGDTNATYLAGDVDEESRLLVERTAESLRRAIKSGGARSTAQRRGPSDRVRQTLWLASSAISPVTGSGTISTPAWWCRTTTTPHLPVTLESGMTFTIEPMLTLGTIDYEVWDDDWTVVTADRRRSAQFEHTILVTASGAEILTCPRPTERIDPPGQRPGSPKLGATHGSHRQTRRPTPRPPGPQTSRPCRSTSAAPG